jgi:hypothetical protein
VRTSAVLLACSLLGVILGAALVGRWAVGVALIADSVAVGVFALLRDTEGRGQPGLRPVPTLPEVLERARAS